MRISVILLLLAVLATACAVRDADQPEESEELLPEDYQSWESTTDTTLDFQIPGHGETLRRIYINPRGTEVSISEDPSGGNRYDYPEGSLVVKEIYPTAETPPTEDPVMLTAMLKTPEDPRARGGWLWIIKNVASGEETVLEEEYCLTCHENANEPYPYFDGNPTGEFRDYIFYPYNPDGE